MATEPIQEVTRADVERAIRENSAQVVNVLEQGKGERLRLIPGSKKISGGPTELTEKRGT